MENSLLTCGKTSLVGFGTMMIQRSVISYMNNGIRASGLSINQMYVLYIVNHCRGHHLSYMARKAVMDRTTLTRAFSSMKKYISIYKDATDNRFSYPALTAKGVEILDAWMPRILELEESLSIPAGSGDSFIKFVNFFSSELIDLKKKTAIISSM
jgi:DNA-binding MarR family transcriptional regulator